MYYPGKWFEPRGTCISYMFRMIIQVRVVLRKTVFGDWRFDYLSSSHLKSQDHPHPDDHVKHITLSVFLWCDHFDTQVWQKLLNLVVLSSPRQLGCVKKKYKGVWSLNLFYLENIHCRQLKRRLHCLVHLFSPLYRKQLRRNLKNCWTKSWSCFGSSMVGIVVHVLGQSAFCIN